MNHIKKTVVAVTLLATQFGIAQNITDVVRASEENIQGTARYQAMAGAFGALGGDLSAINNNPAGSAVFTHNLYTVTGSHLHNTSDASYFGTRSNSTNNSVDISQAGGVFVFNNTLDESPWKKITLALNYDISNNLNSRKFIAGTSTQGADNYFLNFAQGVPFGPLLLQDGEYLEEAYLDIGSSLGYVDQQAFLGYYGGIIDPVDATDNANTAYTSNAIYNTVNQKFLERTTGYNSKFTANVATQYQNNLYLGASLNFHTILYNSYTSLDERGYDAASPIQYINFDNRLITEGNGFSFNLGAIARITDVIRLGASYQSPTWYGLTDETSQRINSDLADDDIEFIDFSIINIFERYRIKTPGKITASAALVINKQGIISFDYGFQDFTTAELRPKNDANFTSVNADIKQTLTTVNSYRIGGEYRIANLSLRAGYRTEDRPFILLNNDGRTEAYSGGIGYHFGNNKIDLGFSNTKLNSTSNLLGTGFSTAAQLQNTGTQINLSYSAFF